MDILTTTSATLDQIQGGYLWDLGLGLAGATMASAGASAMSHRATTRALADRIDLELIPSPEFDPKIEDVFRLAAGFTRTRRTRFGFGRAASSVRIMLCSDPASPGMFSYRLSVPRTAIPQIQNALPVGVDMANVTTPDVEPDPDEVVVRRRAVMGLARRDHRPLRFVPVTPDPKEAFANAISGIRPGEWVALVLDLMPVSHGSAARWHRELRRAGRQPGNAGLGLHLLTQPLDKPPVGTRPTRSERNLTKEEALKSGSPLFRTRILAVGEAPTADRAASLVKQITDPLAAWRTPEQWLRASGHRVLGIFVGGADAFWRRAAFDREFASGVFSGHRRAPVLSASELSGLLVPPTATTNAGNLTRSGSSASAAPPALVDYSATNPDIIPLGVIRDGGRERHVGVSREKTLFAYVAGASGAGKSQWATNLAIHLATNNVGLLFVDPDQDAIEDLQHYLGDLAHRVKVINLRPVSGELVLPGWNPLAVPDSETIETRVADVVSSFAAAGGWDTTRHPRAISILEMAASSLCELGLLLQPEDCPTVFQIETIINDTAWREAVIPYLPLYLRTYWRSTFRHEAADATVTVSRLIHRLWMTRGIRALLGSSVSTYDVSAAMQRGDIVLVCPAAAGRESTALLTNLLASNAVRSALNRKTMAPANRREFWVLVDEVQEVPPSLVAEVTEHGRKFKVHLVGLNQTPERLKGDAWTALVTNSSLLMASSMSPEGADRFSRKWGTKTSPANLDLWTFLVSTRLGAKLSDPFLVHGTLARDTWSSRHRSDGPEKIAAAGRQRPGQRPASEVLADLETLDNRILVGLRDSDRGQKTAPPAGSGGAIRGKHRVVSARQNASGQLGLGDE